MLPLNCGLADRSGQTTGAMGFRLDAIKHMDRRFLLAFVRST